MKGWNKYCNKCAVLALAVLASGVARCDTVELEVYSDKFDDVQTKPAFEKGGVASLMAVTNSVAGGEAFWLTTDGEREIPLYGVVPVEGAKHTIRVEIDFEAKDTLVRYLVKNGQGEFVALKDGEGAEWIRSPAPEKKDVREVEIRRGGGYVKELKEVAR